MFLFPSLVHFPHAILSRSVPKAGTLQLCGTSKKQAGTRYYYNINGAIVQVETQFSLHFTQKSYSAQRAL
ncbi:MAG TPA: hypothetical protein DCL51_06650 [Ruthenibacterium lactatiformans]|jgi:hypothetical protein|nr:hypothetical protein [Ruthenibacterium lactatiformans]RGD22425.1 hypothetical protein DW651_01035 [Subdoligranulum sp. AM23-21AC]RJW03206.1 hypothetical protein DWW15_03375 [Subdoligranulum sp. AF14-43]RJW34977.1 hypothetical protein DXC43_02050 [Subdoligranulum sp. TF05-17AC]HAG65390.1 hypothetical protein [Ruthenibacterium lactatiformans]